MTTIEIKQGIAEDGFDKSDLINRIREIYENAISALAKARGES